MDTQTRSTIRRFLGNRTAVVAAGTVGFMLGAGGFVAAQQGADDPAPKTLEVETSVDDTIDDDSATHDANDDNGIDSDDDSTSTSLPGDDDDDSATHDANDDNGIDSDDDSDDDSTSTSLPGDDDSSSTSLPGDDDSSSAALPAEITTTYTSNGGSIIVTWSGTAFSIDSIDPAADYKAEIEDNSWDKVRVDFDFVGGNSGEGHNDSRIEVRLHEGSIQFSID